MRGMKTYIATTVTALLVCAGIAAASDPEKTQPRNQTANAPAEAKVAPTSAAKAKKAAKPKKKAQIGHASWYGKQFHGRTTASGEDFDMYQLTAAHPTLPLGTWIKVTNFRNGKWVVVKVNDRGPYVGERILDLSYGAAQVLGFRGVERVKIEIVEPQTVAMADRFSTID
jgi:rare lipoprotein A